MKKGKGRKGLTLESVVIAIIIIIVVVIGLNLLSFAFGKGYESGEGLFGYVGNLFGLKPTNAIKSIDLKGVTNNGITLGLNIAKGYDGIVYCNDMVHHNDPKKEGVFDCTIPFQGPGAFRYAEVEIWTSKTFTEDLMARRFELRRAYAAVDVQKANEFRFYETIDYSLEGIASLEEFLSNIRVLPPSVFASLHSSYRNSCDCGEDYDFAVTNPFYSGARNKILEVCASEDTINECMQKVEYGHTQFNEFYQALNRYNNALICTRYSENKPCEYKGDNLNSNDNMVVFRI